MDSSFANQIRKIILDQSKRANVGHIGSSLSVADIMAILYEQILQISTLNDPERDRFVLSKGHAALALYAAFFLKGWISFETLSSYCSDSTYLGVHPEHPLPGVDFGTGSLGMGVSYGVGAALAARLQNSKRRTFVLMSDAECNEGNVWEAVMFAAHHNLSNLHVIIDLNGQQALGYTQDVLNTAPLAKKWEAFGWHTQEVDGHDKVGLENAIQACAEVLRQPHVIIAHTIFGKGVSFMEQRIKWHYWPMSDLEYEIAVQEVSK